MALENKSGSTTSVLQETRDCALAENQIGYMFLSLFRTSALPLDALISGKVRSSPSTSSVNWPERITDVATRT